MTRRGRPNAEISSDVSPTLRTMATKIRKRREQLGLTLEETVKRSCGLVSVHKLSAIELGTEPKLLAYVGICIALGCELDYFVPSFSKKLLNKDGAS